MLIVEFYLFLFCLFVVFHSDGALKIAPACLKFKLLKAECLTFLGRIDVSLLIINRICIFVRFFFEL